MDHQEAPSRFRFASGNSMRLTKGNVSKITFPKGKAEHIVYDDELPGFGLRLHPSGRQTWFVQFRLGRKQRRITLGTTATVHPEEARRIARDALAKVHLGRDPQAEKSAAKGQASLCLGFVAEAYLTRYAAQRLKPRSFVEVQRHLRSHWAPLAEASIVSIGRPAVSARLAEIANENGPFAANRARAALSALFAWAIGEGLADNNPVAGTHRPTEEVTRDRVLNDAELALVWKHAGDGDFGTIVRLLILTAARREEIGALRWSELQGSVWRLPGDRAKNGRAHELPLPAVALEVLERHFRRDDRDLVFGSRVGPFGGWSKAKAELDARMTLAAVEAHGPNAKVMPWRLHDLRRTAATRMVDLGVQPHVVEAVLNHLSGHKAGVAGVYNRASYIAEKAAALKIWADHVTKTAGVLA